MPLALAKGRGVVRRHWRQLIAVLSSAVVRFGQSGCCAVRLNRSFYLAHLLVAS